MAQELQYLLETKRLVWLAAVVFAVFMMVRYIEFPYGGVISSLFSAEKDQITENGSYTPAATSQIPQIFGKDNRTIAKAVSGNLESETNGNSDDLSGEGVKIKPFSNVYNSSIEKNVLDSSFPLPASLLPPPTAPVLQTLPTTVNATPSDPKADKDASNSVKNLGEPGVSQEKLFPSQNKSSANEIPLVKESPERLIGEAVTFMDMRDILVRNRASSQSMKPRWSSAVDQELLNAKLQIENAPVNEKNPTHHPTLYANVSRFKRSYELMEKTLKVYIYKEGEKPIFHQPQAILKGIYASEGWFMKHMKESKHFVTKKPKQAHLFYIPFSSRILEKRLYVLDSHRRKNLVQYLKNYLDLIVGRYSFWNRTGGSDHFLVACHDWAPSETKEYLDTCIRAMCNSDVKKEGFELGKDVALPTTNVRSPDNPLGEFGGKPPSQRSTLAFFAGQMHGHLRPILLRNWGNKDPDMKIFGKLSSSKKDGNYVEYMKSSKYCICAKGYEVNSPRVVEAIFYECVPVILSDNFVPPFFEVLNWESFAVFVREKDVPNLKNILLSIPQTKYLKMQERVKQVQHHFLWHVKPVKYDIFHMILHSIWYNRVFRVNPR